jgi:phage-related protein
MKAINDFRIKVSDIAVYKTGIELKKYQPVYYTGMNPGSYTAHGVTETVSAPFQTGYYYSKFDIPSGENYFYARPDNSAFRWTQDWNYTPSYGSSVSFQSNLYSIYFGDSYVYNVSKNENSLSMQGQLMFNGITDLEAKSISHFYQNNQTQEENVSSEGLKKVNLTLFEPYNKTVPAYISDIDYQYTYADVNTLTVNVQAPFISNLDWKGKLIANTTDQDYDSTRTYNTHDYIFSKAGTLAERGTWFMTGTIFNGQGLLEKVSRSVLWTKDFYFKPDMSNTVKLTTRNYKNQLDRFYLMQNDNENPNLMGYQLQFTKRSDKEAKALLHYLEERNGIDAFEFDGVPNLTGKRTFFCPRWNHTYNYKDNNSISATFVETLYGLKESARFNTYLTPRTPDYSVDFGYVPSGFAVTKTKHLFNSGSTDNLYEMQPMFIRDEVDKEFADIFVLDDSEVNKKIVSTFDSGALSYTFYITDLFGSGPDNSLDVSGPTNYIANHYIEQYSPENGEIGPNIFIQLTGRSDTIDGTNFPTGPNSDWLGFNKYCISSPSYDAVNDALKITTSWRPPSTGYFFESFEIDISEQVNFSTKTGKTVSVEKANPTLLGGVINGNLYGNLSGLSDRYETYFDNLELDRDYYIRVRGINTTYSAQSKYTYSTGVWAQDRNIKNDDVKDGYTIAPVPISYGKIFLYLDFYDFYYYNLNVYNEVRDRGVYSDNFEFYSGVVLNISPQTSIGSSGVDSEYLGSMIITGDYSPMVSGLEINMRGVGVYGAGGAEGLDGNTAIYVCASGDINLVVDESTIIGGGGGGGHSFSHLDVSGILDQYKEDFAEADFMKNFLPYPEGKLNEEFFENYNKIYGGLGAGLAKDNLQGIDVNSKRMVEAPTYLAGSAGYKMAILTSLEEKMFSLPDEAGTEVLDDEINNV